MTAFDCAVLAVLGLSVALSLLRGFTREIFALASWLVAAAAAAFLGPEAAGRLPAAWFANEALRLVGGYAAVFLAVWVLAAFCGMMAASLVKSLGLGPLDRVLGGLFGLARGLILVMIGVLLAGLTSLPQQPAWRQAVLSGPLEALAQAIKTWLPAPLAAQIHYGGG